MPVTRRPSNPVPQDYVPPNTKARKVHTGDTLASIAVENGMTWQTLADLNWRTHNSDEINWYLHRNVGCQTADISGNNYQFTDADSPGIIWVPDDSGPRPGGGSPGLGGTPGPAPDVVSASDAPHSDAGRVARNRLNILALPVVRLPIGWQVPQPTEFTRFRLWVPTDSGGILSIKQEAGGQVDLRQPARTVLVPAAQQVMYDVPPGTFGEFFVLASGAANDKVTCTFVQKSFSRAGSGDADPALIPWNFYYWPTALTIRQSDGSTKPNPWSDKAADVMERYGRAFGKDGAQCRAAEKRDHGTPSVGDGWEGHCHNAAPASILFETPAAASHNGESFTDEEMKYLAAEFFGNFGQFGPDWWELKRATKPAPNARWYLPGYFKPAGPKTMSELSKGLQSERMDPGTADTIAATYVSSMGGDAAFGTQLSQWFGELAAEFYDFFVRIMKGKKHAFLSNMRTYGGSRGPEEVWNQGYFWYRAWYQENGDTHDEKDMIVFCRIYSNLDTYPSMTMPASVSGNDVTPDDFKSLVFDNEWRIQFDGSGKIIIRDARNEWRHLRNNSSEELYAPTNLLTLARPGTSRKSGDAFGLGNKFVDADLVSAGLLKVHKRYQ